MSVMQICLLAVAIGFGSVLVAIGISLVIAVIKTDWNEEKDKD